MKRLPFTGILSVYILFSVGVNVLVHTCGGSQTIDFMPVTAEDPCGCSDVISDDACCTLSFQEFQINDDQNAAPRGVTESAVDVFAFLPVEVRSPSGEAAVRAVFIASSPPQQVSPTILGCTLLI